MKTYLELNEVTMMEKAATNLRDKIMIHLLFRLGCRISEALSIKIDDIDFAQGTVTIVHLKSRVNLSCISCGQQLARSHTFCPKCGGKVEKTQIQQQEHRRQRVLPVDDETLSMLKNYIRRGGPVAKEGKTLIFGINRHRSWQIIKECSERAGLPKLVNPETGKVHNISPHKFRDAFAIHAMKKDDSGDGMRLLQEHLGHQSFNTTAKYRKISGKESYEWYQRLWQDKD